MSNESKKKIIIYQVLPRLFGNDNNHCTPDGDIRQNGCGKMADFTAKALGEIKKNLVAQLTASVRWTQTVKQMIADGATDFTECGPGAVLQGLIKKIDKEAVAHGIA